MMKKILVLLLLVVFTPKVVSYAAPIPGGGTRPEDTYIDGGDPDDGGGDDDYVPPSGGGEGIAWVPYLDNYPFQEGAYMTPGSGDTVKPSITGRLNLIRFAPVQRYKDSGASVCEDSFRQKVESMDISDGDHFGSYDTVVGAIYENCWDYSSVLTAPPNHVVAGLDTLEIGLQAIPYRLETDTSDGGGYTGSGRVCNNCYSSMGTKKWLGYHCSPEALSVAEALVMPGTRCDQVGRYGFPFYFRPADHGLPSDYYSFTAKADSGYMGNVYIKPWNCKYSKTCQLHGDIWVDADAGRTMYISPERAGERGSWSCITNVRARAYHCSERAVSPKFDPEDGIRSLSVGSSPTSGYTFYLPGSHVRYWFDWKFETNFDGSSMTRIFRSRADYDFGRGYVYNQRERSFTSRVLGSDDEWTAESASGLSTYFSFSANQNKEYRLSISGFTGSRSYFAPVTGFGPMGVDQDSYLPFRPDSLTGFVYGMVYHGVNNVCAGETSTIGDDWKVECKPSGASDEEYKQAYEHGNSQYTCLINGNVDIDLGTISSITVRVTPNSSEQWSLADCNNDTQTITLSQGANSVNPFYIWQGGDPWLQTVDGDVGAQGSLAFSLPSDEYLAIVSQTDNPGVVSYNSGTPDFGEGLASTEEWLAETALSPKGRTFSGFQTLLGDPAAEEESFPNLSSLGTGGTGTYFYDNDISIESGDNLTGGNKIVLLVNGDVTIDADLTVIEDDFLAIIASGTITFGADVAQSQGIFFAGDQIIITESETQFLGEGMFLAANGFSFGRDLEAGGNLEPAEIFTFRPDLLINSPSGLWITPQTWQEVAP